MLRSFRAFGIKELGQQQLRVFTRFLRLLGALGAFSGEGVMEV